MLQAIRATFYHSVFNSWLITSGLLLVLFCFVFYGIDEITTHRNDLYHLYFQWELQTPYLPFMLIIYMSVLLLPFLLPFTASTPQQIKRWGVKMSIAILIAGVCFLIMPSTLGYASPDTPSWVNSKLLRIVTGSYNLVPSLHVALSLVTINTIWQEVKSWGRLLVVSWGVLLSLSTLLTHQHHLLDVISGLILGWIVIYWCQKTKQIRESL